MATEVVRKDFGMTDKGNVVVVGKLVNRDDEHQDIDYEVRHGVRVVRDGLTLHKAENLAKALTA